VGLDPGSLTFTRTGPTGVGLRVFFDRNGTATAGVDYSGIGTFVDIPPGQLSVTAIVNPLLDLPGSSGIDGHRRAGSGDLSNRNAGFRNRDDR
jgi:hypothetical protein